MGERRKGGKGGYSTNHNSIICCYEDEKHVFIRREGVRVGKEGVRE